jgi:hypothetical protein
MSGKCNVIHFLSNPGVNELYCERVLKYLQPDHISYNFMADTSVAFKNITGHPDSKWDILVTDADRLKTDLDTIRDFLTAKSHCRVVVLGAGENEAARLPRAVSKPFPSDIDDWLEMMHSQLTH